MAKSQQNFDAIIIGGGLVGGVAAISLAEAGLHVAVVDRDTRESLLDPRLDGRTTAVSLGSQKILDRLGIWKGAAASASPILHIKVVEGGSPWAVHYDHKDVGDCPMGYIADNRTLRHAIYDRAEALKKDIAWFAPTELKSHKREEEGVHVELNTGQTLKALVLVGAEGRMSPTREAAGIKTRQWSYDHKALVCIVEHEKPHNATAWEIFYPEGPVAFLPLIDDPKTGAHRSGIVWSQNPDAIEQLLKLTDDELSGRLYKQFPHYGSLTCGGQRWSYPLSAQVAHRYIEARYVMVGDAAHVMHPVAGQGVNLGWRDAADLGDILGQAKWTGTDLGSHSILRAYQRKRVPDMCSLIAITDGVVRLFGNKNPVLYFLRNAGLGFVNMTPPLKRVFMRRAMGL